jgi:hypothetical protein
MRNSPPSARILRGSQTANATPARPRPAVSPEARAAARAEAETHYRNGLAAFQRQDLDGAIAAWDRTLALDPAHKGAQVNRTQALDLKRNLQRVREHAQAPALAETQ